MRSFNSSLFTLYGSAQNVNKVRGWNLVNKFAEHNGIFFVSKHFNFGLFLISLLEDL